MSKKEEVSVVKKEEVSVSKKERVPMISRSFNKDTIRFNDIATKNVLWEKNIDGTATSKEVVKAITEFTDKHWDKMTPWIHSVEQSFEVYEMPQSEFIDKALKLEGEELQKRIDQIKKNREKRGNK